MIQDTSEELLRAVTDNDRDRVEELLVRDPGLATTEDEQGRSALLLAVYHGHREIVNLLASRLSEVDLSEASASGDVGRVRDLLREDPLSLSRFSPDGFTPLGLASFFGHPEVVELLLEEGADPDIGSRNSMEVRPIHSAAAHRDPRIAVRITRLLLEAGAEGDPRQAGGWTPLHLAAQRGNLELVRILFEGGASPDARADGGKTPLDLARRGGHAEVAALLAGASGPGST